MAAAERGLPCRMTTRSPCSPCDAGQPACLRAPQDEYQKLFWKLRQAEWEPFKLQHAPLTITQVRRELLRIVAVRGRRMCCLGLPATGMWSLPHHAAPYLAPAATSTSSQPSAPLLTIPTSPARPPARLQGDLQNPLYFDFISFSQAASAGPAMQRGKQVGGWRGSRHKRRPGSGQPNTVSKGSTTQMGTGGWRHVALPAPACLPALPPPGV